MLRRLREIRNLSQVELAKSLNVSQATVSKMERRSDMYISTLRKLLQAIGGDLEITARFPGYAVRISQFEELDRPEQPEKQGQKPKSRSGTPAADTVRARSGRQRH
ncbi:MAG: helix-turn-helix transcriptional regulator [Armatimonadetes bacterium]|nr:helix-turn-helix transcriptional regulator [Armatimonadota bacterium]